VVEAAGQRAPWLERPAGLTEREAEVVGLLARGLQTKQVARALWISVKSADRHVQNAYGKMGVSTRAAATLFAIGARAHRMGRTPDFATRRSLLASSSARQPAGRTAIRRGVGDGVAMMVDNAEGSQETYERVREQLGLEKPAGGIFHVAGPSPNGGWRVIEAWESEEDARRFVAERVLPAFEAAGAPPPRRRSSGPCTTTWRRPATEEAAMSTQARQRKRAMRRNESRLHRPARLGAGQRLAGGERGTDGQSRRARRDDAR
jgi:DNA-binding CsgD family transcriptional regulator